MLHTAPTIDHCPFWATMTGDRDAETKTVTWMTEATGPNGEPMVQKTLVTQEDATERVLVLLVPAGEEGEFTRFIRIVVVERQ